MSCRSKARNIDPLDAVQLYLGWQLRQLFIRVKPFHRSKGSVSFAQMAGRFDEAGQIRKSARYHKIVWCGRMPFLRAFRHNVHVRKPQLRHRLTQESAFLMIALNQRDSTVRPRECDRYPRQTGATADVRNGSGIYVWKHRQTVEDVMRDHFSGLAYRREIVDTVPLA